MWNIFAALLCLLIEDPKSAPSSLTVVLIKTFLNYYLSASQALPVLTDIDCNLVPFFVYNALFTLIETNREEDIAVLDLKKEAGPTESSVRERHPTISPGPRPISCIQMQTPWLR